MFVVKITWGISIGIVVSLSFHQAHAAGKRYAAPTIALVETNRISIGIRICAGASAGDRVGGAPHGFCIEWAELHDANTNGVIDEADGKVFSWDGESIWRAQFADGHRGCNCNELPRQDYLLAERGCVTVKIGDLFDDEIGVELNNEGAGRELACGRFYVFRSYVLGGTGALAIAHSPYSQTVSGKTAESVSGCMVPPGRWAARFSEKKFTPVFPSCACPGLGGDDNQTGLCLLSGDCYNAAGIAFLLKTRFQGPGGANRMGRLAHQVIAVEMSFLENCGGLPPTTHDGVGELLSRAHAALRSGDSESAPILRRMLSQYVEDNLQ